MNTNPTSASISGLLPKLKDADADYRFMSLNDLYTILTNTSPVILQQDYNTCARLVDGVVHTLDDQNGEVQNLAIKCLGPLVVKIHSSILPPLIEKLTHLTTERSVDRSVPTTALRTVISNLPRPTPGAIPSKAIEDAYAAISKVLIPRLVGYLVIPNGLKNLPDPPQGMLEFDLDRMMDPDALDIAIEVARCFGPMLKEEETNALQSVISHALDDHRSSSVVNKKAIVALSVLASYFSDDILSAFISKLIESFRDVHLINEKRRLLMSLTGAMVRSIPQKFGPYLMTLTPFILSALSEEELAEQAEKTAEGGGNDPEADEVREAALVALESFLASCSTEMRFYTTEIIHAALLFLKYDPNVAQDESDQEVDDTQTGEDGEDDDFEIDEEFEGDGDLDDDTDLSWKVRRCATKVIYTLISTRASGDLLENGTLYDKVAPALLERFKEREENVRLEILATMGCLIRKTGEGKVNRDLNAVDDSRPTPVGPAQSRKRRRGGSDSNPFEMQAPLSSSTDVSPIGNSIPSSGPRASLAKMSQAIVESLTQLLEMKSPPTRQASLALLKELLAVQHGVLSDSLDQITGHIADAIRSSSAPNAGVTVSFSTAGTGSASGSSLRMEALSLAAAIADTHQSNHLKSFLEKLEPEVELALKDKYYKVSSEAIHVLEQFVKALTPPRFQVQDQFYQKHLLERLQNVIVARTMAAEGDGEVRQLAMHALGTFLARTSGPHSVKYLSHSKRYAALDLLADKIKNETTRMAAIRAIGEVASHSTVKSDFETSWVQKVSLELGAQLRKADRSVRAVSLATLRNLVVNPAAHVHLKPEAARGLTECILPLVTVNDLHLLGPALVVLANLIKADDREEVDPEMVQAICSLTMVQLGGAVLDALLSLVKAIGEQGAGKPLMQMLLQDVGIHGDVNVVGKVMGTLLVAGGSNVGVRLVDFTVELQNAQDDKRKCLALAVLGEAGLRLGDASPIAANVFMAHFNSEGDQVPLAAAVALGRAGTGKAKKYMPAILQAMNPEGSPRYLLLHSIKEILQHASETSTDISSFSSQLWNRLLEVSQSEDNRAVGAECIGRLTIIDPKSYLSPLQSYLKDENPSVRGMVIQAIRFALGDSDDSWDNLLQPVIIDMLTTMLHDSDLENARLALTTLIAATHNKPYLILPHLGKLLPPVMRATVIKPHLIREVQMGPFKHKVDDGLESRKSAYETLYALMETAFSRLNTAEVFDRVIAGLDDEHDIRMLCNVMLTKLIVLEPDETQRRLDRIVPQFRAILSFVPKENAVKQELEKAEEASKGVLRVSLKLNELVATTAATTCGSSVMSAIPSPVAADGPQGQNAAIWRNYWEFVKRDNYAQLKSVQEEMMIKDD
ncbi:MAG: hypothetical protein M1816_000994 [Peltula sp. TS41687]|nr:MAG: hypothetical protein M1816_000994 [Peltula sp. TS41687]